MPERRPNRTLGGPHDRFWSFCNEGELRLQRCDGCGQFAWPPVERCEGCGGTGLDWQPAAGTGGLVSWATFHQPYHREMALPYTTVLVGLAEGPLFVSNPLGFGPDEMYPGMPVQVAFLECEDDAGPFRLPVFGRLDGATATGLQESE
jgi:uncharacterized OB-fold protein